jgi:putative ABC transport system permease protein
VVIVNEALVRQMFADRDPLGRRIQSGLPGSPFATIVGIVKNTRSIGLDSEPDPETFYPYLQVVPALMGFVESSVTIVVRAKGDPDSLTTSMRGAVRQLDPDLAVFQVRTMEEMLANSVAQPRFRTLLIVAFASAALVLAVIGLYGVLAYSVTQRTQEIGVRMALGASSGDVLRLVVGQGMRLSIVGSVIGIAASFFLTRLIEKLLFGVKPWDAEAFIAMPLLLLAVTLAATYIPARRALKIDPITALRND